MDNNNLESKVKQEKGIFSKIADYVLPKMPKSVLYLAIPAIIAFSAEKADAFTDQQIRDALITKGITVSTGYSQPLTPPIDDMVMGDIGGSNQAGRPWTYFFVDRQSHFNQTEKDRCVTHGSFYDTFNENGNLANETQKLYDKLMGTNTAPTFTGADITPKTAYKNTEFSTTKTGFFDVNEDPEGYKYQWKKNGSEIDGATSSTLINQFIKGDTISAVVTAYDGYTTGNSNETTSV